jgi:hypothetical protein
MKITTDDFTRINNDVNGNPRYVLHFIYIDVNYIKAVNMCKCIGGRKYHTKDYAGGIVFQSYSLDHLIKHIYNQVTGHLYSRKPSKAEIKMGYGARHYKSFLQDVCRKKKKFGHGDLKEWLICPEDGLRYYL